MILKILFYFNYKIIHISPKTIFQILVTGHVFERNWIRSTSREQLCGVCGQCEIEMRAF